MNLKTLQKIRFFLAAAFPVLARLPPFTTTLLNWLDRHPRLKSRVERVRSSRFAGSMRRANESLLIGDHADDRIDASLIPPEAMGTLRNAVIVAVLLCLLAPLAMTLIWPALPLEPITGAAGAPVAGWSVVLWMLGAALAWACLLAGTGLANRVALPPALAVFCYFNLVLSAGLPRSWWSLLLLLIAVGAIVGSEARIAARPEARIWPGIAACLVNGMMAGFTGLATTPAGALFKGRVLPVGLAAGAVLGLGLWWLSRWLARRTRARDTGSGAWPRADVLVPLLAGLHLAFIVSLAVRGGLLVAAQGLHPVAVQIPGYLWPLYYFIGVGVIFKILRQTKALHGALQEIVPPRVLVPLGLCLLGVATAVAWSHPIVVQPGRAWLPGLLPAAEWIAGLTGWIWRQPFLSLTMEWARWVFIVAFALAVWTAIRRRLDGEVMARLLFATALLWFAVAEYFFEFSAFGRTSAPSPAGVLGFAIFILWLAHMTLRKFIAGDSPGWPRPARVVMYGTGLMFILLPLHARAAMHDPRLAHEILLYLFFGILDLGLPFYLHLYASRHFKLSPFPAAQLLGCFGVGAGLAVAFTLLDKLAVSAWSPAALWAVVDAQVASILQQGRLLDAFPAFLPPAWVVVRGLLVWSAILGFGVVMHRRMAGRELAPAATVFAVVAAASGVACFSNRTLELPLLSPHLVQLLTPMQASRTIDVALVARYLSYVVPALIVGLALTGGGRRSRRAAACGAAVGLHLAITWLWPAREPWLRSTGLLATAGAAGALGLFVLVVTVRDRLATVLLRREGSDDSRRFLTPGELRGVAVLGFVVLGALAVLQLSTARLVERRLPDPAVNVALPAHWRETPATGTGAAWQAPLRGLVAPQLTLASRPAAGDDLRPVLQAVAEEAAPQIAGFKVAGFERWERFQPGALALEFEFERPLHGATVTFLGTIVVAPAGPGTALVFTLHHELGDRDRRWDIVRALQNRAPAR